MRGLSRQFLLRGGPYCSFPLGDPNPGKVGAEALVLVCAHVGNPRAH